MGFQTALLTIEVRSKGSLDEGVFKTLMIILGVPGNHSHLPPGDKDNNPGVLLNLVLYELVKLTNTSSHECSVLCLFSCVSMR